jgi:hypothetical protein
MSLTFENSALQSGKLMAYGSQDKWQILKSHSSSISANVSLYVSLYVPLYVMAYGLQDKWQILKRHSSSISATRNDDFLD